MKAFFKLPFHTLGPTFPFLPLIFLLAACTPRFELPDVSPLELEKETRHLNRLAVKADLEKEKRLTRIGFKIKTANAPLCDDRIQGAIGAKFTVASQFKEDYRQALKETEAIGSGLQARIIVPGSPADHAGLMVGDKIIAVNGTNIQKDGANGMDSLISALNTLSTIQLTIERKNSTFPITVNPVSACSFPIVYLIDDGINAFADGKRLSVTAGMMRFLKNDDELAWVLSHEMAHSVMRIYVMGHKGEFMADYLGAYFTARAGYDLSAATDYWRRMAAEDPASIGEQSTGVHPSTAIRIVAIEKTVEEIEQKRVNGLPLEPEEKNWFTLP
ncbi:M48 family metalloprotease [Magnetococcales bacterium HHB-1]